MNERTDFHILTDHGETANFAPFRIPVRLTSSILNSRWCEHKLFDTLREVALGTKIWWVSIRFKGIAPVVTYGFGHGLLFALLQLMGRPLFRPRTHVVFDLLLEKKRTGLAGLFDTAKMFVFRRSVDCAAVWGVPDTESFAREYSVPSEKFVFVPYHHTLEGIELKITQGGYIFAGGNGQRDYVTLIEAVKPLTIPVFIATTLPEVPAIAKDCPHVTVKGVTDLEFRQKMAGCSLFVECHSTGYLRTAGHQTMLNAMWMGKPMVLADRQSAIGYIEDGEDGIVVEVEDVLGLRAAIQKVWGESELANRLGRAARAKAHQPKYRTRNHIQEIYNIALAIESRKRGLTPPGLKIDLY